MNVAALPWVFPTSLILLVSVLLAVDAGPPPGTSAQPPRTGAVLYAEACAACHGVDGTGAEQSLLGFEVPPPDFTDCDFAAREPDADWLAVAHAGGPVRAFAPEMPALGEALTDAEIARILAHVRTFCTDDAWPRGDLNLPRPLVTTKAFVEDEAVWTTTVDAGGRGAVINEIVYEQRFGARNQWEIVVPFGFRDVEGVGWTDAQLGDVAFGMKRALYHDLDRGTIVSGAAEVLLPTGDETRGFGGATTRVEPFVAVGQLLPWNGFVHLQAAVELPLDRAYTDEALWRGALGTSLSNGRWGRTWSPMVELLGSRELAEGAVVHWDVVPQFQVTLNTRQHVMANVGVRLPADGTDRDPQVMVYLLWDWFDGGLTDGW